jgi:phosphonopyruvate decarboxylase
MLETIGIPFTILTQNYESEIIKATQYMELYKKPYALIVRANSFSKFSLPPSKENYEMSREEALKTIIESTTKDDIIVCTTGKSSREIYEIREKLFQSHDNDFLTVGSMGHASSIALGIALNTTKKVYTIDGDGAFLMHMGATAINNQNAPLNLRYILINNRSHESVGGQPTIANQIKLKQILLGMGFKNVYEVNYKKDLVRSLISLSNFEKSALIVNVSIGSRSDLGRPKTSPIENKIAFMKKLKS